MRQRLCPGHRPSLRLQGLPAATASSPGLVPWVPAEGCPGPHLVTQPSQAPGSSRGGKGERRGSVPPTVRWRVLLLPRWGFGRGRDRC